MSALRRGSLTRRVITEREQLQEGFLQARRMEAVGRLGGGTDHDRDNPRTAIVSGGEDVEGRAAKGGQRRSASGRRLAVRARSGRSVFCTSAAS